MAEVAQGRRNGGSQAERKRKVCKLHGIPQGLWTRFNNKRGYLASRKNLKNLENDAVMQVHIAPVRV